MKTFLIIICCILWMGGLSTVVYGLVKSNNELKYCGKVKYKIDATRFSKYQAHADPILVIDFEGRGIVEVHPTWNSYMSTSIGQEVCYMLRPEYQYTMEITLGYVAFAVFIIAACLIAGMMD